MVGYFLLSCTAMFGIFAGKVYLPQSYLNQYYPWRYELAKDQPGVVAVGNPWLVDAITFVGPQDAVVSDFLKSGEFPMWNPRQFCGHPLLANSQSEMTYPVKLFFSAVLKRESAHNAYLFFHLWMAGFTFYVFCRLWYEPVSSFLGGTLWMLGGFMAHYLESKMGVVGVALPLTLLALERLLRAPRDTRRVALLAAAGGLSLLSSHKQFTIYIYLFAALYWVARTVHSGADGLTKDRCFATVGAFCIALLLGAPLLGPYLEFAAFSGREPFTLAQHFAANRYFPENLLTLFLPEFWGGPEAGFYLTRINSRIQTPIELTHHLGTVGMLFAICGMFRKNFVSRFFSAASIYFLLATMFPIFYAPLYYLIPVLSHLTPTRILLLSSFSLCVLAVGGMEVLQRERFKFLPTTLGVLVCAVLFWVYQAWTNSSLFLRCKEFWLASEVLTSSIPAYAPKREFEVLMLERLDSYFVLTNPVIFLPLLCGAAAILLWRFGSGSWRRQAIIALALVELLFYFARWNPVTPGGQTYPHFPALDSLQNSQERLVGVWTVAPPNSLTAYSLSTPAGYDSIRVQRFADLFSVWQQNIPPQYNMLYARPTNELFWKWCALMGVQHVYTDPMTPVEIPESWERVYDREWHVYRNPEKALRTWLVTHWTVREDTVSALREMKGAEFNFRTSAVVDQNIAGSGIPGSGGEATISEYRANRVVIQVEAKQRSLLILNDSMYPGWTVTIDEEPAQVVLVDAAFRGVMVEAGTQEVVFRFRPRSFYLGLVLFGLGLAVMVVLVKRSR